MQYGENLEGGFGTAKSVKFVSTLRQKNGAKVSTAIFLGT